MPSFPCTCRQFRIPWHRSWTSFNIPGTTSTHAPFSSFVLIRQVLLRVLLSTKLSLIQVAPYWPQKVFHRSVASAHHGTTRLSVTVEPSSSTPCPEASLWSRDPQPSCVEVILRMVQKAGFTNAVAKVTAVDLRHSTTALYQSK